MCATAVQVSNCPVGCSRKTYLTLFLPSSYGIAVLFILVSCLLHLVATAYFLFLEMLNKRDNGYVWVQMLWIIFHFLRLLMVVEPCHLAARESRKTIQIVCEIERKVYEPILAEEIKKFWQQLLVVDADFSASGLCRVNRTILTSVSCAGISNWLYYRDTLPSLTEIFKL